MPLNDYLITGKGLAIFIAIFIAGLWLLGKHADNQLKKTPPENPKDFIEEKKKSLKSDV